MRWYRKAQLVWFGVFSVAFMTIAWAVLPVTQLTTANGTTFVLDHVIYTVVALVLAGLLAVAAGAETDYQDALRRYGFSSSEAFDPNKAMMYWMRVGAILFILAPFVILGLEVEGHLKPISLFRAGMSSDAGNVFMLLYNSVYGLCVTLLAIDFFLTPMSAQIVHKEASFTARDKLIEQAFAVCTKFLGECSDILSLNIPELRGTPQVHTRLMSIVDEVDAVKRGTLMLPINEATKNLAIEHMSALQADMTKLIELPKFLRHVDQQNRTAGKRRFRAIFQRDMSSELDNLKRRLDSICADLQLTPPPTEKQDLVSETSKLCAEWERVRELAITHYKL